MTGFSLLKDKLGDVLCRLTGRERMVLELRQPTRIRQLHGFLEIEELE